MAINSFSKKNGYVIYFQKKPFQVPEKTLDLFPVPLCHFFFVLLASLASFFLSTRFVLALFLTVIFEEPVAHQKMILFSDYRFFFCFFLAIFLSPSFTIVLNSASYSSFWSKDFPFNSDDTAWMKNVLELILRNMTLVVYNGPFWDTQGQAQ